MISRTARRRLRRFTARSAIAAVACLMIAPSAALGQQPEPETGEIANGRAQAQGLIARVGPAVGDLELAIRAGLAITQLTNNVAQSTSQTLDLGLIGTALTAESCGGGGIVAPEQLPQPTDVDNRGGAASLVEDEAGQSGDSPVSAGRKSVGATTEPVGSNAKTTAAHIDLGGVLKIAGGESSAVTEVLPGKGRQATASVKLGLTLGPLKLTGLEWNAIHRTGVDPHVGGSFKLADLGGTLPLPPIPLDSLEPLEAAINTVSELLGLGLTLEFPRVVHITDPVDLVRVTPLRITLEDSPTGAAIIAPLKVAAQPGINSLFDAVTEAVCQAGSVLLVGDVALSVLAGSGALRLEVGGVQVASSRFEVTNPFGEIPDIDEPLPIPSTTPPTPTTAPSLFTPTSPAQTTATTPPASQEVAAPATVPQSNVGPLESFCASVHPNGNSCSEGAAMALGLIGLLVTVALAGYEIRKQWPTSGGGS